MPAPRDVTVSPDREAPAHPTAILAIICISYFVVILDNSIIFTLHHSVPAGRARLTALTGASVLLAAALLLTLTLVTARMPRTPAGHPAARPARALVDTRP